MNGERDRRLETEALVVGYAMSRLDRDYLSRFGLETWSSAFDTAAASLEKPAATFKNLRDEFDPFHRNERKGLHVRPIRLDRQRVMSELEDVSDDALEELVRSILEGRQTEVAEAVDALSEKTGVPHNVAERLLTGRRAEQYYLEHSHEITGHHRDTLLDCRNNACGYDFAVRDDYGTAIEIKGMKLLHSTIQFTDREWIEASQRRENYLLVVVGNLAESARARLVIDPYAVLKPVCVYQRSITATWRSRIDLESYHELPVGLR